MNKSILFPVAATAAGIAAIILVLLIWRCCRHKKRRNSVEPGIENPQARVSIAPYQLDQGSKKKGNLYAFRSGVSGKRVLFSWAENPSMAVDAGENGWSRFSFTNFKSYLPSSSKRSSALLGSCAAPAVGDSGRESQAEISWEVSRGSAEFMQKVRLNPGMKNSHQNNTTTTNNNNPSVAVASVIKTVLPLPGPLLENHAFPQEAYFEITILNSHGGDSESVGKVGEGEKTKLLFQGNSNAKGNSEALVHVTSSSGHKNKINSVEEMKLDIREAGKKSESVNFSLGLTTGGPVLLNVPGSYPGSIGFNSNGSVYLDGMKLVFESDKAEWTGAEMVIGCGFDPRQKKVFFTIDSELMHVIHCQSQAFGTPLYPTLAANIDIQVLVNYGQNAFKYAPANAQRTPNPCFIAPLVNSPAPTLSYDDSRELFSMGRIDAQWLNRSATKGSHNSNGNNYRTMDFDEESEADLFEIVLDGPGKSPYSTASS